MWKIDISPGWPRPIADVIQKLPQIRKSRIFIAPKPVFRPENKSWEKTRFAGDLRIKSLEFWENRSVGMC